MTLAGVALFLIAGWWIWEACWFADACYLHAFSWLGIGSHSIVTDTYVNGAPVEPWKIIAAHAAIGTVFGLGGVACWIAACLVKTKPSHRGREM